MLLKNKVVLLSGFSVRSAGVILSLIRSVLHSGINERQPKIVLDMGDPDMGGDIAAHMRSFQALADRSQWPH